MKPPDSNNKTCEKAPQKAGTYTYICQCVNPLWGFCFLSRKLEGTDSFLIQARRLVFGPLYQGLRASSLQFTSPLEFNVIFRDGFPLRLDLNG